jgi:predicted PurR-regulated permease PerM
VENNKFKLQNFLMACMLAALVFYLLIVGQAILLPLVIAIVFWYLISLMSGGFGRIMLGGNPLPTMTCYILSFLTFFAIIWGIVELIASNIAGVVRVAPIYQANLEVRWENFLAFLRIEQEPTLAQFNEVLNLGQFITGLAASLTNIAANMLIIIIYVIFLLLEQGNFSEKVASLANNPDKEKRARQLLSKINEDVKKYISIKMLTSSTTGILSYILLKVVGVDFAEFWALLIFLLNFIPTIGSIVATIFPSLITLVQFDTYNPFFAVFVGVTAIQVCVGSILEPRLMGNSLNLSPLIILLNLSLWGLIWGIPGMFLCVPLLVISMIVFSHVPATRPIAILLSRDGRISEIYQD